MHLGDPNTGMMAGRDTSYIANAVRDTGTTNYLTWSGQSQAYLSDSSTGSLSLWFKLFGNDTVLLLFGAWADAQVTLTRQPVGSGFADQALTLQLLFGGAEGFSGKGIYITTAKTYVADGQWHHMLASWDVNHAFADMLVNLYIDNESDIGSILNGGGITGSSHVVAWPDSTWYFWDENANGGFLGMSEVWLDTTEYIDFSIEANRLKFRSPNGYPIPLGSDGSLPTGTAPFYYLTGNAAAWGANSGTGIQFVPNSTGQTDITPP